MSKCSVPAPKLTHPDLCVTLEFRVLGAAAHSAERAWDEVGLPRWAILIGSFYDRFGLTRGESLAVSGGGAFRGRGVRGPLL